MPTNIPLVKPDLQESINNMHRTAAFYLNQPALYLVRALAPAGATYPRAAVVHQLNGKWAIRVKHHAVHYEGDYPLDEDGIPLTFDRQRHALTHAAHTIHAFRARRHPAGQSWLRAGGQ